MISTHVLDTWAGIPAAGVKVELQHKVGEKWSVVADMRTDADGRVKELFPPSAPKERGVYRLIFSTGEYFEERGQSAFHPVVTIAFEVRDETEHHHVPLLLGPYSYTTYRGS